MHINIYRCISGAGVSMVRNLVCVCT